jgi:hypothetical protein
VVAHIAFVTKHCLSWVVADRVAVCLTSCDIVKRQIVAVLAGLRKTFGSEAVEELVGDRRAQD